LCLQVAYKFYLTDKPKLLWFEHVFSISTSERIRRWVHKIIKLNKDMNIIYSIIALVILIICLGSILYTSLELINNLNGYVNLYLGSKNK
jgi:hypothetical protein